MSVESWTNLRNLRGDLRHLRFRTERTGLDRHLDFAAVLLGSRVLPTSLYALACLWNSFDLIAISSALRSSLCVASPHECPKGSTTLPKRSPQNMSATGIDAFAPASTAR